MKATEHLEVFICMPLWVWFLVTSSGLLGFVLWSNHYLPWSLLFMLDALIGITWLLYWSLTVFTSDES